MDHPTRARSLVFLWLACAWFLCSRYLFSFCHFRHYAMENENATPSGQTAGKKTLRGKNWGGGIRAWENQGLFLPAGGRLLPISLWSSPSTQEGGGGRTFSCPWHFSPSACPLYSALLGGRLRTCTAFHHQAALPSLSIIRFSG